MKQFQVWYFFLCWNNARNGVLFQLFCYLGFWKGNNITIVSEISPVYPAWVIFVILDKTGAQKIEDMTKEKMISGNYLVSIGLAFFRPEEYDLACCGIVSNSNSNS